MASQVPPKKNTAFVFYAYLVSQADTKIFQTSATLAEGDVKVAIDDGDPANLDDIPVVDANFTKRIKVTLTAAEMNGDVISVLFSDAAGAEWCDASYEIPTSSVLNDDLPTAAEINAEVDTALADYDGPTSAELVTEINSVQTDIAAVLAAVNALDVIPAASAPDAVVGGNVSRTRGTRWSFSLTGLGSLAAYDAVVLTVKDEEGQADTAALLQVYNDPDTGLIRFNGAAPVSVANGEITIDDEAAGDITVTVEVAETVSAPLGTYYYDVMGLAAGGVKDQKTVGRFTVTADIGKLIVSP